MKKAVRRHSHSDNYLQCVELMSHLSLPRGFRFFFPLLCESIRSICVKSAILGILSIGGIQSVCTILHHHHLGFLKPFSIQFSRFSGNIIEFLFLLSVAFSYAMKVSFHFSPGFFC